ncbi:MAG: SAM-dependent methyltransferase [Enhygromyxa sp.]
MFASPQREDGSAEQRVLEGPGALAADDPRFAALFSTLLEAAEQAAAEGLVKQAYVIDERTRLELDARHGHVKQRTLDAPTVAKIMGGKDRPLRPDRSARLLRGIGIMNPDGSISARNAKKYKQVNHFVELCRPLWAAIKADTKAGKQAGEPLRIVDLACGNSYLSFVVLEALALEGRPAKLLGVDLRTDVIATSRTRAEEIGFGEQASFIAASLEQLSPARLRAELGGPVQLAISLHACDTATDAALALAIASGVEAILCVPCCQAELARQLAEQLPEQLTGWGPAQRERSLAAVVPAALEHGLLRRTLGELLTDALRVELLEACGYAVTTLEFVGSEHTPKNLLLRALRGPVREPADWQLGPIAARCEQLGVDPALLRALTRLQADLGGEHQVR